MGDVEMRPFTIRTVRRLLRAKGFKAAIGRKEIYGQYGYSIGHTIGEYGGVIEVVIHSSKGTSVMRTHLPIESWGVVTHLKERYCTKCETAAGIA